MNRADKLLVAAVLAAALLATAYFWLRPATGSSRAVISTRGEVVRVVNLGAGGKDYTFTVNGRLGTSTVEVSGERIRMLEAPCPGRICMHQGWISGPGSSIVCMPGEIVIRVEGATKVDAVTR